ncbi:DUF4062 domain-containing protein [Pectobacterium brasiliense]|uniref:DUF4062 domain-containing protein n=1 Tax=Pectobacterium brasiliense TaxID=180957 RepID=UPI0032EDF47E
MEKKYQVFLSSTYEDLQNEREQAIKAVLELGHIPVGMEMFSAADEHQWELIKRQIEQSDYYILILAHRYGSETPEKISYTEKEFDYAIEKEIPTLSFIIDNSASWPNDFVEANVAKKKKLDKFKSKVKNKLVQFWVNKEDLHGKITISFVKAMSRTPRVGWVRSNEVINNPDVTNELSRLSNENSSLRKKIEELSRLSHENVDEVENTVEIMSYNERVIKIRSTSKWNEAERYNTNLLEIFLSIGPNLIVENSSQAIANNIALRFIGTGYYSNWPIATNIITKYLADFVALDLVEPSKKKHSVSDNNLYWSLTKLGKSVLKRAHRIKLEKGLIKDTGDEKESEK